jgi:acetyltransferase-like isoleucine patch superfamily enzyme
VTASIGRHCIIGAGALVLSPVPDYCIAVGVPARVIRDRRQTQSTSNIEASLDRADCMMKSLLSTALK